MIPQSGEDRETKLFNLAGCTCLQRGSAPHGPMPWVGLHPAPACVNITKIRSPNVLLWPHKHILNLFCLIRPGLTWPVGCYSAQISKPGAVTKLRSPFAALPKVSTMGSFFTITLFLAIRRTPSTSVTVTTMGRPSGMAATARLGTAETQQLQHRGTPQVATKMCQRDLSTVWVFLFIHVYPHRSVQR